MRLTDPKRTMSKKSPKKRFVSVIGAWRALVELGLKTRSRRQLPNLFQPFNHTQPDRYPWLFQFVRDTIGDEEDHRILSVGCSIGEEVVALRRYFPATPIKGLDIDPRNIVECLQRTKRAGLSGLEFDVAGNVEGEMDASYDAIFCLAVLCNGKLTVSGAERSDPILYFDGFERMVEGFARCLKSGGLLCLVTTNFRFCDTAVSTGFDVVLRADPEHLAPDVIFDRNNRLMRGVRYAEVVFSKR